MPEKKGTVAKVRVKPDVLIKGEKQDMYFVTLADSQAEYSGIGSCPWKKGETAEFAYIIKEEDDKTYLNITGILNTPADSLKKASELNPDAKIDRLILAIAGAKVSVSIDKTISERPFEPKKYSIFLTLPIGIANPAEMALKVHELLDTAENELSARINGKASNPKAHDNLNQVERRSQGFQDDTSTSTPGQKSLIPKTEPLRETPKEVKA
jgi:hypothetical protein